MQSPIISEPSINNPSQKSENGENTNNPIELFGMSAVKDDVEKKKTVLSIGDEVVEEEGDKEDKDEQSFNRNDLSDYEKLRLERIKQYD